MSDTENLTKKYTDLARRIARGQSKLKRKNPENSLLTMVVIDEIGIHWTKEFGAKYMGVRTDEGLCQYVNDLERAMEKDASE